AVLVMLGKGDGTFQHPVAYPTGGFSASALTSGDFNGDGNPDLAVVTDAGTSISVLLGDGDGSFQPPLQNSRPAGNLATGDFNGDGNLDLVSAGGSSVWILLGNGDGTFQPEKTFLV